MSSRIRLEDIFPGLKSEGYKETSPADPTYNCIAWAAGDTSAWWEPDPMGLYYWPSGIPRRYSLQAYRGAYESIGYKEITGEDLDIEYEKIALFTKNGIPKHASRQLQSGFWTSKLGRNVDIRHRLRGVCGDEYGEVELLLRRRRKD